MEKLLNLIKILNQTDKNDLDYYLILWTISQIISVEFKVNPQGMLGLYYTELMQDIEE